MTTQASAPPLFARLVARTMRIPRIATRRGDGATRARQLDGALMQIGFKLSAEVLTYLGGYAPEEVTDVSQAILIAIRTLLGDHVQHNVYFKDFPANVPDTLAFWMEHATHVIMGHLVVDLNVNQKYGRYQHSYEAMLEAHAEFLPGAGDRIKILHLGDTLENESRRCYQQLLHSAVPLNEADRALFTQLAAICMEDAYPDEIPVRENRALFNVARMQTGRTPSCDTIGDVLRLACALCDGDVTLTEPTRFKTLPRATRRILMEQFSEIKNLEDVARYRESLKRLGERLHPHEFKRLDHARKIFAIARGEQMVKTRASEIEQSFKSRDLDRAIALLQSRPGQLARNVDRILRAAPSPERLYAGLQGVLLEISGRVLLSLREHLQNRHEIRSRRLFANSKSLAWVAPETRLPFEHARTAPIEAAIDAEITRRLPGVSQLTVDPAILPLALPISDKQRAGGFGVMPRGTTLPVEPGLIRFFIYWKQTRRRTDLDLSALILDRDLRLGTQLSYTNLKTFGGVHSGDVTEAPDGASEFIDIDLNTVDGNYVVPTVNRFSGENFLAVEECFFGFMHRQPEQQGQPFEARTVRLRSDMRGIGNVCMPLAFMRTGDGWAMKWLHLYLKGQPQFNQVEGTERAASLLTRAVLEREYLRIEYLVERWREKAPEPDAASVYIGLERPEHLAPETRVFTLQNLFELIPA